MKRTRSYWLFLAVTGLAMLWLNLLDVPTLSDDIIYRFMWNTDEAAPCRPSAAWPTCSIRSGTTT